MLHRSVNMKRSSCGKPATSRPVAVLYLTEHDTCKLNNDEIYEPLKYHAISDASTTSDSSYNNQPHNRMVLKYDCAFEHSYDNCKKTINLLLVLIDSL